MVPFGISAKRLEGGRQVVMLRRALIRDYQRAGLVPTVEDAFNFSMWRGYLSDPYHSEALDWCRVAGAEIAYIHTSARLPSRSARLRRGDPPENSGASARCKVGRGVRGFRIRSSPQGR